VGVTRPDVLVPIATLAKGLGAEETAIRLFAGANVVGVLPEALTADVQAILADQTVAVRAGTAGIEWDRNYFGSSKEFP